jgi:gluconokinase
LQELGARIILALWTSEIVEDVPPPETAGSKFRQLMIIVLMGVSGSGKTTIGQLLAGELGWTFYDADDFHPPANVEKMRLGEPLNDSDRIPWLEKLRDLIRFTIESRSSAVVACSALKSVYREYLLIDERVRLVYLKGTHSLIKDRLSQRQDHYMNPSLLESQFATLEEPEQGVSVDVTASPADIVQSIRENLAI